jgi:membrane protease YdiL (CAAX protease family)
MPLPFVISAFIGMFGPTFAALIMAGTQEGGSGLRKLLSRWKIWRVGIQWYIIIPVILIAIQLAAIQLYIGFFAVSPQINLGLWYMFFLDFLASGFMGGPICEETGWRGYALPRMLKSQSALKSGLILGVMWAVWHVPGLLIPGFVIPVPLDPLIFLNFLLDVISLSVIMTWLFNNTRGSVLIAFLFHSAHNSIIATVLTSIFHFENIEIAYSITHWFVVPLQWVLVILLIILFGSTHLSHKLEDNSNTMPRAMTAGGAIKNASPLT